MFLLDDFDFRNLCLLSAMKYCHIVSYISFFFVGRARRNDVVAQIVYPPA